MINQELFDSIDAARIAKKLGDVEREVAFVVNAIECLEKGRARLTLPEKTTIRNFVRHRDYRQACLMLEE